MFSKGDRVTIDNPDNPFHGESGQVAMVKKDGRHKVWMDGGKYQPFIAAADLTPEKQETEYDLRRHWERRNFPNRH